MCSKEPRRASVAVLGAGPAGLAVARELLREGHSVTIFEAGDGVGGAWRFDETATDSDMLGLDDNRVRVHSSMYPGLRTNLPRHLMSLCDFPFSTEMLGHRAQDTRAYPLHTEVLAFCETLADAAGLRQHLVLHTRVVRIDPVLPSTASGSVHTAASTGAAAAAAQPAAQPLCQHQNLQWRVVTVTDCQAGKNGVQQQPHQQQNQQPNHHQQQLQEQQQADGQQGCLPGQQEWVFDAVASCVGTFSEISLPQIPGMRLWPGQQLHSHNYRGAAQFKGQKVMVVGASFSGEEIARHIAREAREVLHCARTFTGPGTARQPPAAAAAGQHATAAAAAAHHDKQQQQHQQPQQPPPEQQQGAIPPAPEPRPNITRHSMLSELRPDGSAVLVGGQVVRGVDAIVYCTGYKYSLPWMDHLGLVQEDNACVRPLFAHMFIPSVGPSLALCGLPWRCAKFPQFQLQGQLLARLLSGRAALPPPQVMEQAQQQVLQQMAAHGIPMRYMHCMASFMPTSELAYAEQLVKLAASTCSESTSAADTQAPPLIAMPGWMAALATGTSGSILGRPDTFRDKWSEELDALMVEADKAMHQLCVAQLNNCRGALTASQPCQVPAAFQ